MGTYGRTRQTLTGGMFRELGLPTTDDSPLTSTLGASTSMGPPPLPAARPETPLTPLFTSYTPRSIPALSRTVPTLGRPPVVTPTIPVRTPASVLTPERMKTIADAIEQRLEAKYPGQTIPIARILQTLLPEGYNITTDIPGLPPTAAGFDAADGPPPMPAYPQPQDAAETEEVYMARLDRHYRLYAMYLQEYQGYDLRMRTR